MPCNLTEEFISKDQQVTGALVEVASTYHEVSKTGIMTNIRSKLLQALTTNSFKLSESRCQNRMANHLHT